jgi:transposase InsO family protein
VNVKRVHRLWRRAELQIPHRKVVKRRANVAAEPLKCAAYAGRVWTYDFMTGHTESGRALRILNVLDEHTREALAMLVAPSVGSRKVLEVLDWLFLTRGTRTYLRSDNGPEFIAQAIRDWLHQRRCQILFITPGSPWENPFIESFSGHFRAKCLDRYLFANAREAQNLIDAWRTEYNHYHPHSSLGYRTPAEFAAQEAAAQQPPATIQHILSL